MSYVPAQRRTPLAIARGAAHFLILAAVIGSVGLAGLVPPVAAAETDPASSSGLAPIADQPSPADVPLRVGETASLDGGALQISFVDVREDSRCPKDVMCVWSGRAVVDLHAVLDGVDRGDISVTLYPFPRNQPAPDLDATVDRYVVSLADLQPYPDRRQTQPVERVATIHIAPATP